MDPHDALVESDNSSSGETESFDESSASNATSADESGDEHDQLYWQEKIANVIAVYKDATVTEILDKCFAQEFMNESMMRERSLGEIFMSREDSMDIGTDLHEDIFQFYNRYRHDVDDADIERTKQFVKDMLRNLRERDPDDVIDSLIRSRLAEVKENLRQEITQFYEFVDENYMLVDELQKHIFDETHGIRGQYNALFFADGKDSRNVKLYDWTWSSKMQPDSTSLRRKTMQLNIYKHILEKKYHKNVVEMHSVVFHKEQESYVDHKIRDLHFECPCAVCKIKTEN